MRPAPCNGSPPTTSPQGNNERIRTTWFDQANAAALDSALDGLFADLRCSGEKLTPRPHREPDAPR
ncbi:hypothetical protein [Streptomyces solaniscabiei]|uniref:hypothetical protein n=1 Tax=Streptomyces solaniscabiei TaxID=2683255 RepID=UPI001CE3B1BA|nr:hypothetical protein [Streptomyces solaniscabiei]